MPGNVVKFENSKKHYTNSEKSARIAAENNLSRKKVVLTVPPYVKKNTGALAYWKKIRKEMKDVELLDNLDADTLGRYCMLAVRLDTLHDGLYASYGAAALGMDVPPIDNTLLRIEATERNLLAYASKLGLTPDSRARLAKKRAEVSEKDPDDDLYD